MSDSVLVAECFEFTFFVFFFSSEFCRLCIDNAFDLVLLFFFHVFEELTFVSNDCE